MNKPRDLTEEELEAQYQAWIRYVDTRADTPTVFDSKPVVKYPPLLVVFAGLGLWIGIGLIVWACWR
jgi:hypothetical protein